MLSRVQSLSQLFIIESLPDNKFYASPKALAELERLERVSINKNPPKWEQSHEWSLKLVTLNIHSLSDKIEDLRQDKMILMSDIICLTETWLRSDTGCQGLYITGFDLDANSAGEGKGVLTYSKSIKISDPVSIKKHKVQIMKVNTFQVDVINIYRSQGADDLELVHDLRRIINPDKTTIVCGDFNLCLKKQKNNMVTKGLEEMGFQQLVEEASHLKGG